MMDYFYIILLIPAMVLPALAQIMIKSSFAKYSKVPCSKSTTGAKTAALLLAANNITDVKIGAISGSLTDYYAPGPKQIALSEPVCNVNSIAAVGVAAHETGHAIQYATKYKLLTGRNAIRSISSIGSRFGPFVAAAGMVFSPLLYVGIALFSVAVLFSVLTLPVEFNASSRALSILRDNNVLTKDELKGAKKVLSACALSYVASTLTNFLTLFQLLMRARSRKR
jgi:Zn-dependent membrane protease YugP